MAKKQKVAMAFMDHDDSVRSMFPSFDNLAMRVVEVERHVLSSSLKNLVSSISEILSVADTTKERVKLRQVSIAVQFNSEGGIVWIASAKTGVTNSMTLTFEIDERQLTTG